jgi:copper(I)-binding protein
MSTRRHSLARATIGLVAVTLAAVGLVACGDDSDDSANTTTTEATSVDVTVADVWARPVEDLTAKDTSAIYMAITAGAEGDSLVKASVPSDVAGTVELHETVAADEGESMEGDSMESTTTAMSGDMESTTTAMGGEMGDDMGGGMMTMKPVSAIEIPGGETVELKPGGYHVMLLDVKKVLAVGDTIEVTLTFEKAGEVQTTAEVREP